MSEEYDVIKTMSPRYSPIIGHKESLSHPHKCRTECPYGYDKAFCFPCMAKILAERSTVSHA